MHAGTKIADQRDHRSLRLPRDFVAQHQKMASLAEREMNQLAL